MFIRTVKDLGAAVKARRKALGFDQATLAARVGVTRQWIGALEQGKPGAEVALVLRTLVMLDMPLSVGPAVPDAAPAEVLDLNAIVEEARRHGR